MVLEGLRMLLQDQKEITVSATFTNGEDALGYLNQNNDIDIIFLDINLPGQNGFELCKRIKKEHGAVRIVVLSTFYERSNIARMINYGASGYLSKTAGKAELIEAIQAVMHNKAFFSEEVQKELFFSDKAAKQPLPKLTRREKEILILIAEGKTTAEVAEKLFISQLTVETHRKNMIHKLGASNTAALIKVALDNGIL